MNVRQLTLRCACVAIIASAFSNPWLRAQERIVSTTSAPPAPIALKDLDGHFPFKVPASKEQWEQRATQLRQQLNVSLGLFPSPTLAPAKGVAHSRREMDGYTIDKLYFESLPGLYVTGSLYLPTDASAKSKPMPAVMYAHGHWVNGRFYWANDGETRQLLASGAERFESAARNHMQACCVQLARMGCAAFQYDMIGYADSQQIHFDRSHRFGVDGPNPASPDGSWLLFSPQAEGHLQSVMALQTINTLQALDYLRSRPDIDRDRIAITGASGGGTQSFIAAAVDSRFAGAFPAVMVSTGMQGGCTCENACGLRVDTGNVEISALIAPRPLGMTAADDWSRTMPQDGFPELKKLYGLYGAQDRVSLFPYLHFPHNYNHVARVALYGFINRLFKLGLDEPILEKDFEALRKDDLTVWDKEHPAPPSGLDFERALVKNWALDVQNQLASNPSLREAGWKSLLEPADRLAKTLKVSLVPQSKENAKRQSLRIVNANQALVGIIHLSASNSQAARFDKIELVDGIPAKNDGEDTLNTLFVEDAYGLDHGGQQSLVNNPRPAASYTYGYNSPVILRKLAVLIRCLDYLKEQQSPALEISANDASGFIAQAARFMRPKQVARVTANGKPIAFDQIQSIQDATFLPGALRFGEIPTP